MADVKFAFEGSQTKRCLKTLKLQQGEGSAVSKQQQEAVARLLLVSLLQLLAVEQGDSREEMLPRPSENDVQSSEGRGAAVPETLAGPSCCQCDPALPWHS